MAGAVMIAAGYFTLRQREVVLQTAMHNEVRAHALTLQIALEDHYRAGRTKEAQQLIDGLSKNPKVYGVLLFDAGGRVAMVSDPLVAEEIRYPEEVRRVLATGETVEIARVINDQEVFSIIMPIRTGAARRDAFEIAQPMSFVKADIARARRDIGLTTLLLFATIFLVVLVVTRHSLLQPIKEMLGGARALGHGDLDYRVIVTKRSSELAELAFEINRMADKLAEQRKAAEREAERRLVLEREMRHNERLASVGRLAAGVAHEIGTPLNVIDARAKQLLSRSDASPETRQRNLTIIRSQTESITRIVRQLLDLARPYKLRREPVDLSALLDNARELIEADAVRAGIEIEIRTGDQIEVEADRDFLRQVLLNICGNSIQAMPRGGRLRIECMGDRAAKNGRRFAAIQVSDTGEGIAPEHLPHIFEPFFTTKDVGSGTGLGLTVSRRIIEEHGGWVEAANNERGGATFTIYLPQAENWLANVSERLAPESESL
jgi:signal transduction histidine kinase